jgi:lipid II isoglutaminyl synthase (glutamine-hydrolysing)
MDGESRDHLLRSAWELDPFEDRVLALSEISQRIGPDHRRRSPLPAALPYTLRNLAAAARRVSWARGGGATTLPGKVVLQSEPRALRLLARRMPEGCVLVSGTNGKTTTASMIAAILRAAGLDVVHNRAGSNMHWGVATAMLEQRGEIGVFEVDEAWLPILAMELSPRLIVLGNLFRDRLDGYGELDALATAWRAMLAGGARTTLVLNADDAVVASLGSTPSERGRHPTFFFGVEDRAQDLPETEHTADSIRCPVCDEPLFFDARLLSHLGHYRCEACGAKRPRPAIKADEVVFDGLSGSSFSIDAQTGKLDLSLGLPGLYNVYNALAATGAALALGVEPASISPALKAFAPVFGRGERIQAGATTLLILLMKNPAGANELLRTLSRDASSGLDLLMALNDGPADGRDVSWIWDADFEVLRSRVRRVVCTGGRAAELALRLKYAGWPLSRMVVDDDLPSALDQGLTEAPDRLIVLPTYSALLALHIELEHRGLASPYWV